MEFSLAFHKKYMPLGGNFSLTTFHSLHAPTPSLFSPSPRAHSAPATLTFIHVLNPVSQLTGNFQAALMTFPLPWAQSLQFVSSYISHLTLHIPTYPFPYTCFLKYIFFIYYLKNLFPSKTYQIYYLFNIYFFLFYSFLSFQ